MDRIRILTEVLDLWIVSLALVMAMFTLISRIVAYAVSLYLLVTYTQFAWFSFVFAVVPTTKELIISYLLIGVVFFLIYGIVRRVVKFFAFPFQILTLWLIGVIINIFSIYICQYIVNNYLIGISMQLWSIVQIVIGSFILSLVLSVVSYIVKKIV